MIYGIFFDEISVDASEKIRAVNSGCLFRGVFELTVISLFGPQAHFKFRCIFIIEMNFVRGNI